MGGLDMKLLRFVNYDINEGLVRFWKRYLAAILLGIVICARLVAAMSYWVDNYGLEVSLLEYGLWHFKGRNPYHFDLSVAQSFQVPMEWLLQYILLAYCIGSYIRDDMVGFGSLMMLKSGQRLRWWSAKVIWCILVNVCFFALQWCVNTAYAWILTGNVSLEKNMGLLMVNYGNELATTDRSELLLLVFLMPFLVGVVQSVLQMVLTICFGGIPAMVGLTGLLVISSYYGGRFLVHGYAMVVRYYTDSLAKDAAILDIRFGIPYLLIIFAVLVVAGYLLLRKKDILGNKF